MNEIRILVDVSAVLWSALQGGRDPEALTDENGVSVNSAAYGYERAVDHINRVMQDARTCPKDLVLVYESGQSKAPRQAMYHSYKSGSSSEKSDLARQQFSELRDKLIKTYRDYGAIAVTQNRVEADDIIAKLAQSLPCYMIVVTVDNDLMVLAGRNDNGGLVDVITAAGVSVNKYGNFPTKDITIYKSMVGDPSDNIKGIKGFGQKAFEAFLEKYGVPGLGEIRKCLEQRDFGELFAQIDECPLIRKIYYGAQECQASYDVVKLRPEWVDTVMNPLQWFPGVCVGGSGDERFAKFEPTKMLIDKSNHQHLETVLSLVGDEVAFDIETSTPEESDDWLAAQNSKGVDVIGSYLVGFSVTYGDNLQHSVYVDVRHVGGRNVPLEIVGNFLVRLSAKCRLVIHNTMFEGTVLWNEFAKLFESLGNRGLIRDWTDTKLEASYVDENDRLGLKHLSQKWLEYTQTTYEEVTQGRKMDELTAQDVLAYGCDDTICTAALHNFFVLFMQFENTLHVYESVEIDASYLHCHAFIHGVNFDASKRRELVEEDKEVLEEATRKLNAYLISEEWEGCVKPKVDAVTLPYVKLLVREATGQELKTAIRTPEKLVKYLDDIGLSTIARIVQGGADSIQEWFDWYWEPKPEFNPGSPKQLQKLMYEVMGLPVRLYNKPTDTMRKAGLKQGTPKTDNLAITYALKDPDVGEDVKEVLKALQLIKMVNTRFGLFYDTYPGFVHWKTGKIHSQHNQSATNTRRASSSSPNLQQLSKGEKVDGFVPKIREMLTPHKSNAAIVSLDFSSQEVLLMAEWTQDPNLESIFVGENKRDFHAMTGVKIFNSSYRQTYSYEQFVEALTDKDHPEHERAKKCRKVAKNVNFGAQYRIAAPKLSTMLFVTPEEAQEYLDAKAAAFPVAEEWAQNEMEQVKQTGKVKTLLGAVRHLGPALRSDDRYEAAKADRQAISYRIQGSAAEMTKLAEGRMWRSNLLDTFDCRYIAPIHDEVVWSVSDKDVAEFVPQAHSLMTMNYANMRLPIGSSCSVGRNFGAQVELEGDFSPENIHKALEIGA